MQKKYKFKVGDRVTQSVSNNKTPGTIVLVRGQKCSVLLWDDTGPGIPMYPANDLDLFVPKAYQDFQDKIKDRMGKKED